VRAIGRYAGTAAVTGSVPVTAFEIKREGIPLWHRVVAKFNKTHDCVAVPSWTSIIVRTKVVMTRREITQCESVKPAT
jgi:hypothetical protein